VRRREAFVNSSAWNESKKGNPWIKVDGSRFVLFPKDWGWCCFVERGDWQAYSRVHKRGEMAALEGFDLNEAHRGQ
jgi:hypothetical protein